MSAVPATDRRGNPLQAMCATGMRVLAVVRGLTAPQAEVWLRMGRRIVDGMPFAEAKTLFERETRQVAAQADAADAEACCSSQLTDSKGSTR